VKDQKIKTIVVEYFIKCYFS